MKRTTSFIVALSVVAIAGCAFRHESAPDQGGANSPSGSTTAQATAPPQADLPLNHIERADKLIGEQVLTSDHQKVGKIDDFIVDQNSGQILYAVVGIGGILGVGETQVAVLPALFTEAKKGMVQLKVDKARLESAPKVTSSDETAPKADYLKQLDQYYNQPPLWNRNSASAAAAFNSAREVSKLTGMNVVDDAHQDLGTVETVILNVPAGREMYVVLAPSSQMNLGNNYYALPPKLVRFSTDQKTLVADLTREKLSTAPHFAKDDWAQLADSLWAQKVYQYYGQPTFLPNGQLEPTGRADQSTSSQKK